jgi:glycosyltransferase involved in cell wall biosynthesis
LSNASAPEHGVAIVLVADTDTNPAASQAVARFLNRQAAHASCFHLQPALKAVPGPGFGDLLRALPQAELALPAESDFPYHFTFASWSLALMPWVAEHLFQRGFKEVVCLDPLAWTPLGSGEPQGFSIERWLLVLNHQLDAAFAADQSAAAVRNTSAVRSYLLELRNQRLQAAQQALKNDRVILGMAVGPSPDGLRGRICVVQSEAQQMGPDGLQTSHRLAPELGMLQNPHLEAGARLHRLCSALLGHGPDPAGMLQFGPQAATRAGTMRLLLGLMRNPKASLAPTRWPGLVHALSFSRGAFDPNPATRLPEAVPPPTASMPPHQERGARFRPGAPAEPLKQLTCPTGINLAGYIRAELGLGEAARSMAKACTAAHIDVSLIDLGYQTLHPQADHGVPPQAQNAYHGIDLLYVNASHTEQTATLLREHGPGRNRYTIGFWHWEQPELPGHDLAAFQHLDEVWAPSTFVANAIAAVSPLPVFTVPHCVDFEPSPGLTRKSFGLPEDKLLVLVMYDFLSYQHRKNPEAAIAAFRAAARQHPELALVIKTINGHKHPDALRQLKLSVADLPGTTFIEPFLTRQDTWNLQACCDILLSLHRAEGFGLAPAEMMRLGKTVVATGWSANMDFMTEQNSMPVRFELQPLAHDVGAYPAGPVWAEADIEHAAWCLSQLVTEPALRTDMGRRAALDIKAQLSPATVGATIRQRLSVLGHWYPDLLAPPRIDPRFEALGAHLKSKA